jgi:acetyl-CoA synthetase
MSPMSAHESLRSARDLVLKLRDDYRRAVDEVQLPTIEGAFSWAHDWFDVIADGQTRPALVLVEEDGSAASYSFDELRRRSNQVAAFLQSLGVAKGSRVVLMLGNQVELWESMLAVMKLGAVLVPTTSAVGTADLVDRFGRTGAAFVICNAVDASKLEGVPGDHVRIAVGGHDGWIDYADASSFGDDPLRHPGTTAEDPLLLYFTSGTTSRPKLLEHTQVSYPVGHLTTLFWLGVQPGDVHLNISSPGWAKHAYSCFFTPWLAEATVFVYNYARFDAAALLAQLQQHEVATFCAPPTVWRMLIQADLGERPASLRELLSAGEPLNPEVIATVESAWGLTIRDGYGQTETTLLIGNPPGLPVKPGSMGRAMPATPVVIVDPVSGAVVEGAGEGEICLDLSRRPLSLMTGYVDMPEKQAEATEGGWYHTGDVASVDDDGYVTYIGRSDDVFKASDYKISPFELESVLIEHPAVAEAAVVPAPDDLRLAVPKAYIALADGWAADASTAQEILAFARERLAPFQRIRRLEFFELPKTISGKIRRVELRAREESLAPDGSPDEFREERQA